MSSWWAKDDTSDPKEGAEAEGQKILIVKQKQKVTIRPSIMANYF